MWPVMQIKGLERNGMAEVERTVAETTGGHFRGQDWSETAVLEGWGFQGIGLYRIGEHRNGSSVL